uniref:Tubulin/FtsZ GTPase domain-containing protein n=1 Tax=Brassica oleracea var. oleracea TaxID=109376 RepID=A0A0D3A3D1_BRAOL
MSETKGGPYGDQTGAKFWQVICREHGYDPTVRHDDRTVKMRKVTKSDIEMMEKKSKQDKEDHSLNVYIVFRFLPFDSISLPLWLLFINEEKIESL